MWVGDEARSALWASSIPAHLHRPLSLPATRPCNRGAVRGSVYPPRTKRAGPGARSRGQSGRWPLAAIVPQNVGTPIRSSETTHSECKITWAEIAFIAQKRICVNNWISRKDCAVEDALSSIPSDHKIWFNLSLVHLPRKLQSSASNPEINHSLRNRTSNQSSRSLTTFLAGPWLKFHLTRKLQWVRQMQSG